MSLKKDLQFVFSAVAGLMFAGAGFASAGDSPFTADSLTKANSLTQKATELGKKTRQNGSLDAFSPVEPQAASNDVGFMKFLAIKDLCVERNASGFAIREGERAVTDSAALTALMSNFQLFNRDESPKIKLAASSCLGPGDYCSSSIWCCGALACRGGVCSGANGGCIPRGRPCGSSIWCCGTGICSERGYCQ